MQKMDRERQREGGTGSGGGGRVRDGEWVRGKRERGRDGERRRER